MPDPIVTPGAVNPAATLAALCTRPALDHKPKPNLPPWMTEFELSSYNIPMSSSADYVLDYLIPLSLGGANTASNVWPQPRADVDKKAELESKLQLRVCAAFKELPPDQAADVLADIQRDVAADWTAAYADYVGAAR